MVRQEFGRELAMLRRDRRAELLLQFGGVELAHSCVFLRDHEVDAVRVVADMLVNPFAFDLELLWFGCLSANLVLDDPASAWLM